MHFTPAGQAFLEQDEAKGVSQQSDPTSDAGGVSPVHIGLEPPDLLADIGGAAQAKACTDPALIRRFERAIAEITPLVKNLLTDPTEE